MITKLKRTLIPAYQQKENRTPQTMRATLKTVSITTKPPPQNTHQPKPMGWADFNVFYLRKIIAQDSAVVKT